MLVVLLLLPAPVMGNVRPRKADNTPAVGEVKGIKDVIITRETLAVDLRPLCLKTREGLGVRLRLGRGLRGRSRVGV
jgi:hypothetical protein